MRTFNRLKKHGKRWVDELPLALWAIRAATSLGRELILALGERLLQPLELLQMALILRGENPLTLTKAPLQIPDSLSLSLAFCGLVVDGKIVLQVISTLFCSLPPII